MDRDLAWSTSEKRWISARTPTKKTATWQRSAKSIH